ncbi:MAG: hypothetical protein RLZZ203_1944, partial [Cyanobacteriota bacterium]
QENLAKNLFSILFIAKPATLLNFPYISLNLLLSYSGTT